MTGKKLRTLRAFRLALSVLAVILFCLAVVSGILSFSGRKPSVPPTEPAEQTAPGMSPLPSDEPEVETEAPDPDSGLSEDTDSQRDGTKRTDPGNTPPGSGSDQSGSSDGSDQSGSGDSSGQPGSGDSSDQPGSGNDSDQPGSGDSFDQPGSAAKINDPDEKITADSEKSQPSSASQNNAETLYEITGSESNTTSVDTESTPVSEPVTESAEPPLESFPPNTPLWKLLFRLSVCLLIADLAAIGIVSLRIRDLKAEKHPKPRSAVKPGLGQLAVGTVHCQGRRQYQQDSLGHSIVLDGCGVLAVVADGMGGLKDGDKVSQQVVLRTLELGNAIRPGQENGALIQILKTVNEEVNRFLTPDGLYKSGSTVVAVLVSGEYFQWISVGDSRIYLYREGYVNQLNRDHDLLQDWMPEILDGRRSLEASRKDPAARKLTSFIGMGQLKYVDRSLHAIKVMPGDRILLMSDGVYGQLPDEQIAEILRRFPDVRQAAAEMDRCVRATQNPHQDNYTALILGF